MKRGIFVLLVALVGVFVAGCNQQVPTGHIGKVRTVSGLQDETLSPGLHTCFGRDQMYYMEVTDKQFDVPMEVLCKDQLNFRFNIGVLAAVDKEKTAEINAAFENVTPANGTTITIDQMFDMYSY